MQLRAVDMPAPNERQEAPQPQDNPIESPFLEVAAKKLPPIQPNDGPMEGLYIYDI